MPEHIVYVPFNSENEG